MDIKAPSGNMMLAYEYHVFIVSAMSSFRFIKIGLI